MGMSDVSQRARVPKGQPMAAVMGFMALPCATVNALIIVIAMELGTSSL
jgi:hypothetical protein